MINYTMQSDFRGVTAEDDAFLRRNGEILNELINEAISEVMKKVESMEKFGMLFEDNRRVP